MTNDQWGKDVIKAKLTQELRGEGKEKMNKTQKIYVLISNIISAILAGLGAHFGIN